MKFNVNVYPFGIGRRKRHNHMMWKIVGGAALTAAGAGLIVMFPDLKRYIRMSMM